MSMQLTLLIPGLLPVWETADGLLKLPQPHAPALRRLLRRSQVTAGSGSLERALFRLFGWQGDGEPPVAAVTARADGFDAACWMRADPVHLIADLHGVRLLDATVLQPEAAEARQFAEAFDQTYAPEGLRLLTPHPARWYLRLEQPPRMQTTALPAALGRDIRTLLPVGDDAGVWNGRATEVQMLFYDQPANIERERRRQPIVSGLWFWGGGAQPDALQAPACALYADEITARGLARCSASACNPQPATWQALQEAAGDEAAVCVVLDGLRHCEGSEDIGGWQLAVEALERDWFAPLAAALGRRQLTRLTLDTGGETYSVAAADLWKFWRRGPAACRRFSG